MNIGCAIVVGVLLTAELSECLECFNCQNIVDPHACTNTSQCSNDQSCYMQTITNGPDELFNMGCQNNQLCSSSGPIIGRSIQRRQHYACHECCSTSSCNDKLCAHGKLDGNWAEWATWEACSVTCQIGTQTRARSCTNPSPSNGGLDCSGPSVQNKICYNQWCPGSFVSFVAHGENILANLVNAFPTIMYNEGNAYSTSTGHFTAPVDGLYSFATNICTPPYGIGQYEQHDDSFAIETGTSSMTNITRLTAGMQPTDYRCARASKHRVQLRRNENVWVRMLSSNASIYDEFGLWSLFEGCLLKKFR